MPPKKKGRPPAPLVTGNELVDASAAASVAGNEIVVASGPPAPIVTATNQSQPAGTNSAWLSEMMIDIPIIEWQAPGWPNVKSTSSRSQRFDLDHFKSEMKKPNGEYNCIGNLGSLELETSVTPGVSISSQSVWSLQKARLPKFEKTTRIPFTFKVAVTEDDYDPTCHHGALLLLSPIEEVHAVLKLSVQALSSIGPADVKEILADCKLSFIRISHADVRLE